MLLTDQFWQYAKKAILSASSAKTDDERQGLLDLARTWTQAAIVKARAWYGSSEMKSVMEKSGVVGSPSIRAAA